MGREPAPGGSAELLSFLIADIRGYTAFTQSRGDEAAAALAGKFAGVAREGIEAHEGRLLELRGDEALAVFTSARASLRAAVALQEVFADETRLDPGLPLSVGIGLDAGEVVPVEGGYRGGALNRAARLCSLAKGGEALASEGVTHLAGTVDEVTCTEWGTAEVKGLSEPVRAFLVASSDGIGPLPEFVTLSVVPALLDSAVPMLGRDEELRRLSWAWRTARRGCGQVIVVRGPSGIGKTRLLSAVAEVAVRGGGAARFFSRASADPHRDDLRKAIAAEAGPVLVAVDDVEAGAEAVIEALAEAGPVVGRPLLLVLALDDEHASAADLRLVRGVATGSDVVLSPLDPDSVREVAALYLESMDSVAQLPPGLLESTGGVPRRLHQAVASWAEDRATRRLGVLASQAAGSRSEVAVVESELAGTVADLQQVRERVRLYGLGPGRHGPVPDRSPYKGLDSFAPEDADAFFGRERLVADLVARVAGGGLVGVVGPSGSGKSSLVRAGLVPALAAGVLPGSDQWVTVVVRPGEHPVRALDVALLPVLPPGVAARLTGTDPLLAQLARLEECPQVVVVVDQAEELFTVCTDEAERGMFVDGLVASAGDPNGRIDVVLTVRADYYGRFAGDQRLATAIATNQVLVGPMTTEEYRRAITGPAQRHGVTVEPELVDALVDEVSGQPGALPLLSTALVELWEARTDRTMTLASYRTTGGLQAAVARLAESVYAGLEPDQQQSARRMFLRLTGPGLGDTVVKRRVRLADLPIDEPASALVDLLARRRLLTVGDGAVEVAHEALFREWPRFGTWLEEDREGIRLRAHVADAAASWNAAGRDDGELYRGARLSATLDWTTVHAEDLTPVEQEFVTASRTEAQRATAHQQRQNRRLRGLLTGVAVLLVLALIAGAVALTQRRSAEQEAAAARAADTASEARAAGAKALLTTDIPSSLLLAVAAARLDPSPSTNGQLQQAVNNHPELIGTGFGAETSIGGIAVSPDGSTVAVLEVEGRLALFDADTLELTASRQLGTRAPQYQGMPIAFSPDGDELAVASTVSSTGSGSPPVALLDPRTLAVPTGLSDFDRPQLGGWPAHTVRALGISYSADGRRIAVAVDYPKQTPQGPGRQLSDVLVWDRSHPDRPVASFTMQDSQGVELNADGSVLIVAHPFKTYDVASGRLLARNDDLYSGGFFELSPDGGQVAGLGWADGTNTISVADARTGDILDRLAGLTGVQPRVVSWSPTGDQIAGTSDGGSVVVWDAETGDIVHSIVNEDGNTYGLAFSPDGKTLYTGGGNTQLQAWDIDGSQSFVQLQPPRVEDPEAFWEVPSPDGSAVVWISHDDQGYHLTLYDFDGDRPPHVVNVSADSSFGVAGWSPDGQQVVSGWGDGGVYIHDLASGEELVTSRSGEGLVTGTAYTGDGSRVVVTTDSGAVRFLDARTLEPVAPELEFAEPAFTVSTNPSGDTAFVVLGGPSQEWYQDYAASRWALVDTAEGRVVRGGDLGLDAEFSAFSPDGVHAVAASRYGQAVVIDTRTGRATTEPTGRQRSRAFWVTYNQDGSQFLTSSDDGIARIWDARTATQLGSFQRERGIAVGAFRPDGRILLTNGRGNIFLWDPSPEAAMEFACRAAGRDLTEQEWRDSFGARPVEDPCPD